MFLLDTNICIDFVDGRNAVAQQRVREHHARGLEISAITAAELLVGPKSSDDPAGDRQKVQTFLSLVTVHDFDGRAAEAYGDIVRAFGVKRSSFDRLIAAHALSLNLTLVTANVKDFRDIEDLRIADWTQ